MRKTAPLRLNRETLRLLGTRALSQVIGGEPANSDPGHVCESFNACHGSVSPYQCSTDVCPTLGPCGSAAGPCA